MKLTINIHSSVAVYVQIENQIQFDIAAGRLKQGDQLPSVRELSDQIQVNPNTVAKAYRDLEVMGLLYTRRGMGVYVAKGAPAECRRKCRKLIVERIYEAVQEGKSAGISKGDLNSIINASFASEGTPYSEMPKNISALSH
jgi:GntR family transcriptional regulator